MTLSRIHDHSALIAEPLADNTWRVCDSQPGDTTESTVGFIGELGGTYEVRVLRHPERHQFVATFKDAMECFEEAPERFEAVAS